MTERPAADPVGDGAAGTGSALEVLYDRCAARLFRTAWAISGSPGTAEDAVQDVFVGLLRAGDRISGLRNPEAYLFAALRNALARRGRDRRFQALEPAAASIPAPAEPLDAGRNARLDAALRELPADQREVIALKIDGGLTFAQIAGVLDVNANTVASRYRYALERLRELLKEAE